MLQLVKEHARDAQGPQDSLGHVAIVRLADALDAAALSERRAMTIPFARQVLSRLWESKAV